MAGEFLSHIAGIRHAWQRSSSYGDVPTNGGVREVQVPDGYRVISPRTVRHLTADNRAGWEKGLRELRVPQEVAGYYVGMEVTPAEDLPKTAHEKVIARMRAFWQKTRYALQYAPTSDLIMRPQAGRYMCAVSDSRGVIIAQEEIVRKSGLARNEAGKTIVVREESRRLLHGEPYTEAFGLLVNAQSGESESAKRMRERCRDLRIAVSNADSDMWRETIDRTTSLDDEYYALLLRQMEAQSGRISYTDIMNTAGQLAGTGVESIRPLMKPLTETRLAMARAKAPEWTDIWNTADNLFMALRAYEQAIRTA